MKLEKNADNARPVLKVIDGSKLPTLRPSPTADGGFILPPVQLPDKAMFSEWLGMTYRQSNLVGWKAAVMDARKLAASLGRITDAKRELEAALTEYRQILLSAFLQLYPKAARRIMRGLQRRQVRD